MDSGMVVGVGFLLGKNFFFEKINMLPAPQYDPVNQECRSFTFVQKTDVKDNFHRILFLIFLFFLSKSEMFWLPKLPTSTSGDFPKSCSSSYKTCVFFLKRRGCALLSSAVVAGVGLHLWRFPSHVAFAALDLGLGTCRETWTMGCICYGKEVTKKKSKRTCHDYHFFPWMGERVNFFETKVEMNSTSKDWSHDWKYIENASIPGPATRSPISIQFHGC